jgi:hypothetical protein
MNLEKPPQFEIGPEVMKLPEINVREEKGATLLSILLKGHNPNWGGHDNKLSDDVEKFFEQNPLDEKSIKFLEDIKALEDGGVDEEALYNIALTYEHPEREEELFDFISKHKNYIKDPQELRNEVITALQQLESILPSELIDRFTETTSEDIEKRNQTIQEIQERIKNLIDFFKPSPQANKVRRIAILPTDFLYRKESGSAFQFGDEIILRSHIDNPGNLEHEFLHSVINPIVDRLSEKLSDEQKQKISILGSHRLRVEENYGEGFYSLLCEELIRTYNDVIQRGEKPMTHEDFVQKINEIDEEKFAELLQKNKTLKSRCDQLGIKTLQDLKYNSQEYFDTFERNELRDIVFSFYQKYIQEKEKDDKITFEDFVLKEFEKEI